MKKYNLYYNNTVVNNQPLTMKEVKNVLSHNEIGIKCGREHKQILKVSTKALKIVRCILI